jgi:phage-related protein (TIGR01555 family)
VSIWDILSGRKPRETGKVVTPPRLAKPEPKVRVEPTMFRATQELNDKLAAQPERKPFAIPKPMPGVVPDKVVQMAQDEDISAFNIWAAQNGGTASGMTWLGYTMLAELAQRPEYRRISRVKANEMTRKWIRLESAGGESKTEEMRTLTAAMRRLRVRDTFRRAAELDGFFGRSHIYLDTGATDNSDELKLPLLLDSQKIPKGGLKRLKIVEPLWTYPTGYNSTNPLDPDFYKPTAWWVMGQEIHASRLMTFIGREMPDILKPAYMFGGMSLTQSALPYVQFWLQDRTAVSELVSFFSTSVLKTNLRAIQQESGDQGILARIDMWNATKNNRDVFLLDRDTEDFANVSAPLGTLDKLLAQSQEHICSAVGMPLVKFTGITPSGLNASSDGEIRVWYDEVNADQEDEFRDQLEHVIKAIQLSELGAIDENLTFEFVSLWQLDEAGQAATQQAKSAIASELIDKGVITPEEERERQSKDPNSIFAGVDLDSAEAPGIQPDAPPPGSESDGSDTPLTKSTIDEGASGSMGGANSGV